MLRPARRQPVEQAERKHLHTLELKISETRGRTTHVTKEQFIWEQGMREKWEQEEQALVSERKELLQRRQQPLKRKFTEEAPSERRLLTSNSASSSSASTASANEWTELVMAINLDRRSDRLETLMALPWELSVVRLSAVDGRTLSWDALVRDGSVSEEGAAEAQYAEKEGLPTICRKEGSFSPHLTLAAVGCALSHRRAWERIASQARAAHDRTAHSAAPRPSPLRPRPCASRRATSGGACSL